LATESEEIIVNPDEKPEFCPLPITIQWKKET
jgi:hypothetical protein